MNPENRIGKPTVMVADYDEYGELFYTVSGFGIDPTDPSRFFNPDSALKHFQDAVIRSDLHRKEILKKRQKSEDRS